MWLAAAGQFLPMMYLQGAVDCQLGALLERAEFVIKSGVDAFIERLSGRRGSDDLPIDRFGQLFQLQKDLLGPSEAAQVPTPAIA